MVNIISFKKLHRWKEEDYKQSRCEEIFNNWNKLKHCKVTMFPGAVYFKVNDCIVDMTDIHKLCINIKGESYVSIKFLFRLLGGSSFVTNDKIIVAINGDVYSLPVAKLVVRRYVLYMPVAKLRDFGFNVCTDGRRSVVIQNLD